MRSFYIVLSFVAALTLTMAASARPTAAMVIYPWCADYSGRMGGENCGFTSVAQCLLTRAGVGGFCKQNPWYQPYPPPTTYSPPYGDDDFPLAFFAM